MGQEALILTKEKLNNAIANEADFETIYSLSVELDNLIAEYYLKGER